MEILIIIALLILLAALSVAFANLVTLWKISNGIKNR